MRRAASITITNEGRDNGGVFAIEEMPAWQAMDWFMRAMQFLVRSGADVPPNILNAGPEGFAAMGIGTVLSGISKAPWFEVKPLLEELLTCVRSYTPPNVTVAQTRWDIIRGQIEEPSTYLQLYEEVVSLSLGFSLRDRLSTSLTLVRNMIAAFTPIIETSAGSAEPSSPSDMPAS